MNGASRKPPAHATQPYSDAAELRIAAKPHESECAGLAALSGVLDVPFRGGGKTCDIPFLQPTDDLERQCELALNEGVRGGRRQLKHARF
jgi:hypothetical protein